MLSPINPFWECTSGTPVTGVGAALAQNGNDKYVAGILLLSVSDSLCSSDQVLNLYVVLLVSKRWRLLPHTTVALLTVPVTSCLREFLFCCEQVFTIHKLFWLCLF